MSIIKADLFGPINPPDLCDFVIDSFGPSVFVQDEEPVLVMQAGDSEHPIMSSFNIILFTNKRVFFVHQKKKKYDDYPYKQLVDYGIAKDGIISKRFILEFQRTLISLPKKDEVIELVVPAIKAYMDVNL